MQGFFGGVIGHIKHHEDDHQHDRNDNLQSLFGAELVFILAAPFDVIARRHRDALRHSPFRLVNESTDVSAANVHEYGSTEQAVLTRDHRWPDSNSDLCDFSERHRGTTGSGNKNFSQNLNVLPKITRVSDSYGIAFTAFDCRSNVLPPNCRFDHVLDITDGNPSPGSCIAVDSNLHIRCPRDLLCIKI